MTSPASSPFAPVPINFGGVNNTTAPTVGSYVPPTTATSSVPVPSSSTTSTSAPPASPTTTVSSADATNHVTNTIAPTLSQAQLDILNQQSIKAANAANEKAGLAPAGSGSSSTFVTPTQPAPVQGGKLPGSTTANAGQSGYDVFGNPVNTQTPEQQIASQPDTGHIFIYDSKGNQTQVPIGTPVPPGYSTTNPTQGPQLATADQTKDSVGNVYKQFSDGTYGKFNALGAYVGPASQADFTQSKSMEGILTSMEQLKNGTYPLTANQQAQVDGIKAQFAELMKQQAVANANFTGGVTVAENLYGMGNSITGLGEIKGSIDAGLAKIADLNSKMVSAVAQMESAFQKDNLDMLTKSFDMYTSLQKSRQDELDKQQQAVTDAQDKANALAMQQKQLDATTNNAIDSSIRAIIGDAGKGGASAEQIKAMNVALANHDYAGAVQAAAGSLQDPTSPAGQYSAYVNTQKAAGKAPMSAGDFLAAQKYKDAYAAASASVAAQGAYTSSDKNQSKLEHQLQQAALSSRSDLGIQNKKTSVAIDLRTMLNQYKDANGNYNVPKTNYTELAVGLATLLSPTGVPAQSIIQDLQQSTAKGDINKMLTYATGTQWNGTTQDVLKNLSESIDRQGQMAEVLRNQQLAAQTPSDLDPARAENIIGKLPSYDKMSKGDIAYQSPEQIATTAKTNVQSLVTSDPTKAPMINDMLQVPGATYTTIAQKLGLLPSAQ